MMLAVQYLEYSSSMYFLILITNNNNNKCKNNNNSNIKDKQKVIDIPIYYRHII